MTIAALPAVFDDLKGVLLDALEASFDCVKIIGPDGRLWYMNANGCALMELDSPSTVLGARWSSFWPDAHRPDIEQALSRTFAGRPQRLEAPCPTAGGTPKHWDVALAPLHNGDGAVAAALVTSRDITQWRRVKEDALARARELEAKAAALRSAGEVAKIGGWEVDCAAGTVLWSDELRALLHADSQPLGLDDALQIYSPADRVRVSAVLQAAQTELQPFHLEADVTRLDGSRSRLRIFGEPVVEDGVCVRIRGAAQDVSEIAAVEELRRAAERRLNIALELAEIHVFEIDYERGVLFQAGAEAGFFAGAHDFATVSRDFGSAIHDADRARVRTEARCAEARGEPLRTSFRMAGHGGDEVWVSCAIKGRRNPEGQVVGIVGALKNITGRRRANQELIAAKERAEAASRAKSAFLANVSHEIRTPLNGVMGMAQVMQRHALAPDQQARLQVILASGETLMAMLNQVLDLSKIEAGRLEFELHPFQLEETVASACGPFAALAAGKDLDFQVEIDAGARSWFLGDAVRVRQVLSNLVSNAVKFTHSGAVQVTVQAQENGLSFAVTDSGIGFRPEDREALFAPFSQADASITRRYGGSGLGLAICQQLVAGMGGELRAESAPGRGSSFSFALPLRRVGRPCEGQPTRALDPRRAAVRVLAAEDNPVNQLVLRSILEPLGVELRLVADGEAAVDAFAQAAYDIVLMDVQMPVMNGIEATRCIRASEQRSGRPRTPILALSANVMAHQVEEYIAAGMDACVAKPISVETLLGRLAELVK